MTDYEKECPWNKEWGLENEEPTIIDLNNPESIEQAKHDAICEMIIAAKRPHNSYAEINDDAKHDSEINEEDIERIERHLGHPEFESFTTTHPDIVEIEDISEMVDESGEIIWKGCNSEQLKHVFDNVKNKLDHPRLLKLAGLIDKKEAEHLMQSEPSVNFLNSLMSDEDLPKMKLEFEKGKLCVNKVPTVICEDDVKDLYNGYASFHGAEEALKLVTITVKNRLMELFRKV